MTTTHFWLAIAAAFAFIGWLNRNADWPEEYGDDELP